MICEVIHSHLLNILTYFREEIQGEGKGGGEGAGERGEDSIEGRGK